MSIFFSYEQSLGTGAGVRVPYLSGLARRQVKKHRRPRASMNRRRLPTAVTTVSKVGDRRAILESREPLDVVVTQTCWL